MINADISNVWGDVALRDLLELEAGIFAAHRALTEGTGKGKDRSAWLDLPAGEPNKLILLAEKICLDSDVLVVIGDSAATLGIRAVMELLQGPHRNLGLGRSDPQILFIGENLSTEYFNQLTRLLEGRNFSLCVIAGDTLSRECAIALRSLKWILYRKYGTDYGRDRVFVVTDPAQGPLRMMAEAENWETFDLPQGVELPFATLTPAGLLPLAVAGIDVNGLLRGAQQAREDFDLRSFENPVWLYTAVRKLMGGAGKDLEILSSFEPGARFLGQWWQRLFTCSDPDAPRAPVPFTAELPAQTPLIDQLVRQNPGLMLETLIRFEAPRRQLIIQPDISDPKGVDLPEGQALDQVELDTFWDTVSAHADSGTAVMTLECGPLCEQTLGELLWFFQLSRALEICM